MQTHTCRYCDAETPDVTGPIRGAYYCLRHLPSTCRHCLTPIEWFDGGECDWCARFSLYPMEV
jgi:hypothetical protein